MTEIRSYTPLGAGATYASAWVKCDQFYQVYGSVVADQGGTLYIEFSWDGTNVDAQQIYAYTADAPSGYQEPTYADYVRIRFTNGATPQTSFRLKFQKRGFAVSRT